MRLERKSGDFRYQCWSMRLERKSGDFRYEAARQLKFVEALGPAIGNSFTFRASCCCTDETGLAHRQGVGMHLLRRGITVHS